MIELHNIVTTKKMMTNRNKEFYGPCLESDIILDPFLGSGTTAEACRLMHLNFIGIEINPDYCKIAEERLAQGVL